MSGFLGEPLFADRLPFLEEARELHRRFPLCDGHNDLPWFLTTLEPAGPSGLNDLDLEQNHAGLPKRGPAHGCLHTDLPRLAQGGVGWQFWSVFVPVTARGPLAVQTTLEQIDIVKRLAAKYPARLEMAYCADDVDRIFKSGKIACMSGMEVGA
jgi:membrane dipeptidase